MVTRHSGAAFELSNKKQNKSKRKRKREIDEGNKKGKKKTKDNKQNEAWVYQSCRF